MIAQSEQIVCFYGNDDGAQNNDKSVDDLYKVQILHQKSVDRHGLLYICCLI